MNPVRTTPGPTALVALILAAFSTTVLGAETVLPSTMCRGLFIVPVTFGEGVGQTLDLVLDTGAEPTVLTPEAIARIRDSTQGRDGSLTPNQWRVGDYRLPAMTVRSRSMTALSLSLGRTIDGILGFPVFKETLLTLDYPAAEVRVVSGRLPKPDGREIFKVGGGKRPHLKVDVGGKWVPILIDSGATGRFTLRPADRLTWDVTPRISGASMGYSGLRLTKSGRLASPLVFGPLEFEDPIVQVRDGTRLAGSLVLSHFVLTFDQKKKRVRMRSDTPGPVQMAPQRGTGLSLSPGLEGFEVLRVFAGSSAEEADLRPGDIIVRVDGIRVQELGCDRPWDDDERSRITLDYRRDGTDHRVEIDVVTIVP